MKLTTWYLIASVVVIYGWCAWLAFKNYREKREDIRKRELAGKLREARHDGFVAGVNKAYIEYGAYVATREGEQIYGFAEDCRQCRKTVANLLHVRREYWRCPTCGHRNPAPLPTQPEPAKR